MALCFILFLVGCNCQLYSHIVARTPVLVLGTWVLKLPCRVCIISAAVTLSYSGLFIIVLASMVFGILMLVGEHGIYRFIIPHAKKQPDNSLWKRRGLMFFSQVQFGASQILNGTIAYIVHQRY